MPTDFANTAHEPSAHELAIQRLHTCLLDTQNGASRVLALSDAILALQRDKLSR